MRVHRLALLWAAALAGCQNLPERVEVAEPTQALPASRTAAPQGNGAIFQAASYRPLFEDHRARLVGDTLTVNIVEKVSASQKSISSVDKNGTLSASVNALPFASAAALAKLGAGGSSANNFNGKGTTENTNDFAGTITVVVTGVLNNGHLMISGEKQIGVNANVDVLRFSGQVDPRSIQPGNSVTSSQIANVRVEHRGRGQQAEAQQMGWLARFFMTVMPL
jgi:flagellar L-ring protein FlgH